MMRCSALTTIGAVVALLALSHPRVKCTTSNGSSSASTGISRSETYDSAVLDQINGKVTKGEPIMKVTAGAEFDVIKDELLEGSEEVSFLWNSSSVHLKDLLDVFDVYRISQRWYSLQEGVGKDCGVAMETYLAALNQSQLWALKMWDATGRYSSGFFWGDTFWLGSQTLCYRIEKTSPIPVGFNVIKLLVHLPHQLDKKAERVLIGLCLPYSCIKEDVRAFTEPSLPPWAQLLQVRSPHYEYDIWGDSVFWILLSVSGFVVFMLIIGTAYDFYLEHSRPDETVTSIPSNYPTGQYKVNGTPVNTAVSSSGTLSRVILSFSVKLNLETIWDPSVGADTIPIIHGLRFLSMLWVILGHTCIIAVEYSDNKSYRAVAEETPLFQTITKGAFAVDTFFFISGLLVTFLYFRTIAKVDVDKLTKSTGILSNIIQFVGIIMYRYLRLTVPYMYVLGVVQVSMKWFRQSAVFEPPFNDQENCEKYWWRNALYINNFFSANTMCMLWSWYLADDTQFYVLGAVLLILASRHLRLAAAVMATFLATSWSGTAYVAYTNNHMPGIDDPLALFDSIYDKPWTRLGPYLVGMCVGWLLYRTDCKIKMSKLAVVVGWAASTTCALTLVYGLHHVKLHPLAAAAYSSLSHTLWALGLAWIVVACSTGYGGYVNKLLSLSIIHPFSRVTYCAYLVHPLIIHLVPLRVDRPFHLSAETVTILYFGQTVAAYILAFVVSLAFEAPVVSLLKIMSPSKTNKQPEPENKDWGKFIQRSHSGTRISESSHEIRR